MAARLRRETLATSRPAAPFGATFAEPRILRDRTPGGDMLLRNAIAFIPSQETMVSRLQRWAKERPDAAFLSEAALDGRRLSITFAETLAAARDCAEALSGLNLGAERPLMIIAGNGIDHAVTLLGAMMVGLPTAVVSPAYAAAGASSWSKLPAILADVTPGLVLAGSTEIADAVAASGHPTTTALLSGLAWLEGVPRRPARVEPAMAAVGPGTIAKLLFTSGSTGAPKGVVNTQRMMVANMQALGQVWPFLHSEPPVLVDWLPWNHTFGGNLCFNLALYYGGVLHIDNGRPTFEGVGRTVTALRSLQPSVYFNVPAGYEALLPTLESDLEFARQFFSGVRFLFNAGAGLPEAIRKRLIAAAAAVVRDPPPIIGGWGATETAPCATALYFDAPEAAAIGVPLPGVEVKVVASGEGRGELRVRGPNVMPCYWRRPQATIEAFDEDGFYRIGDAGRLADPSRPDLGLVFDGRVAENFKLTSGTWVNVGPLRLALIEAGRPFVSDLVIAGEGRSAIAALVFPNLQACRALCEPGLSDAEVARHPAVVEAIRVRLELFNAGQHGSSMRLAAFSLQPEPPSARHDEITEKGALNQRAVLRRRSSAVEALYAAQPLDGAVRLTPKAAS
ncbi:AMP-binding protein [Caulobacter segnis]|uniref:AMP-binding protein n=1 Tax=Caulobacter segnis TaxID=88688 RepID=UPI0024107FEE|nr:AMP-binding protein [Caulobacter segnis]MDG2520466.1 AMP-binding protein [Caulobacter segnis]